MSTMLGRMAEEIVATTSPTGPIHAGSPRVFRRKAMKPVRLAATLAGKVPEFDASTDKPDQGTSARLACPDQDEAPPLPTAAIASAC